MGVKPAPPAAVTKAWIGRPPRVRRRSQVAGLLEGHEVVRRELLTLLEPLEDLLGFPLRVDFLRSRLGDAPALHPDPMDDLVVVVDLADMLDVLPVLFVREHLRLDELFLGAVRLPPEGVALLVQGRHLIMFRLSLLRELRDPPMGVLRLVPGCLQLVPYLLDILVLLEGPLELLHLGLKPLDLLYQVALLVRGQDGRHLLELEPL